MRNHVLKNICLLGSLALLLALPVCGAEVTATTNGVANPAEVLGLTPERTTSAFLTFGLDRVPPLRYELFGNPLWQYIASLLYIVIALYSAKLLDSLIQVQFRRWAKRTETEVDDLLLDLLRGPVKVITFVILLHVGLKLFSWPDWGAKFISNGLKITVACSLTYVALKGVDLLMRVWQQRVAGAQERALDSQLFPVLRKGLKIFVVVVAVLVTSQNLGMNVTGLLASLSIGGLAIGLAAQDTLSNLFGAIAIFADKPFRVGDRVQLDNIDGTVEAIGLRSTRIRNLDGFLVAVPNRTMANASVVNVTQRPTVKTVMNIGITYDTPTQKVERALAIVKEVYGRNPSTHDLMIAFDKFESFSLNLNVVHWSKLLVRKDYLAALQSMNLEVKRRFDEEKIQFAFPTQTLYVKQDSEWRLNGTQESHSRPAVETQGI